MTPRKAELTRQFEAALSALSGMEALRRENQLLRQKLDQITRRFFGVSSEQLPSNQLKLVLALPEVEVDVRPGKIEPGPSAEKKTPRPVRKARVPEHLPVVEEVLESEGVKAAPEQWRRIALRRPRGNGTGRANRRRSASWASRIFAGRAGRADSC